MLRIVTLAGALALTLAGAAGAQRPPSPPGPPNTAAMAQDFLKTAAATDEYERQAGRIAAMKGQNPGVKAFGRMMQADHSRLTQELARAAREAGQRPPAPVLNPGYRKMLDQLQREQGADFDKLYLQQQHAVHVDALGLMRTYAAQGREPPLRAAAARAAPVIQGHLNQVKQLQMGRR
jgi:putative membrane protein